MPPWSHLHPLLIHFPIALLMVAPLFVALGLLWPSQRRGIHAVALILLLLGALAATLAVATGLAAATAAPRAPELLAVLDAHEGFGKRTALLYAVLGLAFLGLWLLPPARRSGAERRRLVLHLVWLLASALATLSLIRTGQLGGRLVHELGFHAQSGQPR